MLNKIQMPEKYPDLIDRIQSSFIDMILIIILMFVFASMLDRFEDVPDWVRIVLFASLFVLYEPLCTSIGFTAGNYIKGIRVRKENDTSKKINVFVATVRYLAKLLLGWVSFLTIHSNPKKRAIHDFMAGSVMIKYKHDL